MPCVSITYSFGVHILTKIYTQVEHAVRHGYRHLDLAMIYENQHEVGAALKKVIPSVVKREELFITSKVWNSSHKPELVEKELDETLKLLGIDYLDLYREYSSSLVQFRRMGVGVSKRSWEVPSFELSFDQTVSPTFCITRLVFEV
jgi:hypothetical protein